MICSILIPKIGFEHSHYQADFLVAAVFVIYVFNSMIFPCSVGSFGIIKFTTFKGKSILWSLIITCLMQYLGPLIGVLVRFLPTKCRPQKKIGT